MDFHESSKFADVITSLLKILWSTYPIPFQTYRLLTLHKRLSRPPPPKHSFRCHSHAHFHSFYPFRSRSPSP